MSTILREVEGDGGGGLLGGGEYLGGHKGVIQSGDDEGGDGDMAEEGFGRTATVVLRSGLKAVDRGGVALVKLLYGLDL